MDRLGKAEQEDHVKSFLPQEIEDHYPNIRSEGYTITSESTERKTVKYNCVAWAAVADTKKWWESQGDPALDHWPDGVLNDGTFNSYVELFRALGYTECESMESEMFYEKIALYGSADGDFSHVSYQLFSGWTSKLGDWHDIRHDTLRALEGDYYGQVKVLMKRRARLRGLMSRLFFVLTSKLWPIDREKLHVWCRQKEI